ncbi:hypothetical protein ACFFX0_20445 [Citricoccus parietis]|uniref:Uncharacterized protein n=1 Tax=Citricoccus parietis TaxID=592307 RepID=A0ABV5G3D2_9MICC
MADQKPLIVLTSSCRISGSSSAPMARTRAVSRVPLARPEPPCTKPAPIPARSRARISRVTSHPSPTCPTTWSSGTKALSRYTSLNAAPPVIWRRGTTVTPV